MLKIECKLPMTVDILAEKHFKNLNKIVKSGKRKGLHYKDSVILRLQTAIDESVDQEKEIFQYLKGPHGYRLKAILMGQPHLLQKIADDFYVKFPTISFFKINEDGKKVHNELGHKVVKIFNYKSYRQSTSCIENLTHMGIKRRIPCPYCNCDKIDIIQYKDQDGVDQEQALLDLDHYLPKYRYPFLAISIFNLVPSCHNCNSRIKGSKEFRLDSHIHPFLESFDDHFVFKLETPYYDGINVDDLKIVYQNRVGSVFPQNSISDLKLIPRYNSFLDDLHNMLKALSMNTFSLMYNLFSKDAVDREKDTYFAAMGIPIARSEISKYLLGKLKVDLHDDFTGNSTL